MYNTPKSSKKRKSNFSSKVRRRKKGIKRSQIRMITQSLQNTVTLKTPMILRKSITNEYAHNKSIPSAKSLYHLHSKKLDIIKNWKKYLTNENSYIIEPSLGFSNCRNFKVIGKAVQNGKLLNILITSFEKYTNFEANDKVESVLHNLSDALIKMNNGAKYIEDTSGADGRDKLAQAVLYKNNKTVIEIVDNKTENIDLGTASIEESPTITQSTSENLSISNNEVIVLDDDDLHMEEDSDVIFISNKHKSNFQTEVVEKCSKVNESIIVIDDDISENINISAQRKTRLNKHSSPAISPILSTGRPVTRSLNSESRGMIKFTSTPYKRPQVVTETVYNNHHSVVNTNLVTIPEEINNKRCGELQVSKCYQMLNIKTQPITDNQVHNRVFNINQVIENNIYSDVTKLSDYSDAYYSDQLSAFGNNFLNAGPIRTVGLRPVFIDGSNVALGHSYGKYFSVKGLKICIDYFVKKGHEVKAVVPMFRKKNNQTSDSRLLRKLECQGYIVFTPSRTVNGRNIVPYDDRFLVLMAAVNKGIIVSSDNFRDLLIENPNLTETIENRVLNPTWMKDMIIFPQDPLGRNGPTLSRFLQFP